MFDVHLSAAARGKCTGFPHHTPGVPGMLRAPVMVSILAYEHLTYVRQLVENTIHNTAATTLIVLHLNHHSRYDEREAAFEWMLAHPRVLLNCVRIAVSRSQGTILQAHMANVAWAHNRGAVLPTSIVVFQASNMWWVRRGMESYVHLHQQSMPRISTVLECQRFDRNKSLHAFHQCGVLDQFTSGETCNRADLQIGHIFDHQDMPCAMPSLDGLRFLVVGKHEGSFYTVATVQRGMLALRNASADDGRSQNSLLFDRWKQRCCDPAHHFEEAQFAVVDIPLEEVILQSFVANGLDGDKADRRADRSPRSGDVLCRDYTDFDAGFILGPVGGDGSTPLGDEVMRFRIPYVERVADDIEEIEIEANCSWLRQQATGVFALKAHALRDHTELRHALSSCLFPP